MEIPISYIIKDVAMTNINFSPLVGFYYVIFLYFLVTPNLAQSRNLTNIASVAYSTQWLKALHYDKNTMSMGYTSRVDFDGFFLSPYGKTNPKKELQANMKALIQGDLKCRFPFRSRIIEAHGLAKGPSNQVCDALKGFKNEMGKAGLSIVYVSQYADDPASIMGHLFFSLRHHSRNLMGEPLFFLDKTINYAAGIQPDTNPFEYIYKGITGGFLGNYTIYQYADMVSKYNNSESRDIFKYQLKLMPQDVEKALEHMWELLHFGFQDYYFFDENCAYQMLAILEAVLPNKELLSKLPLYTTPIDVLKIVENEGLIANIDYTPSLYQRLQNKKSQMSHQQKALFVDFTNGNIEAQSLKSSLVHEALLDHYNFLRHQNQGEFEEISKKRYASILVSRANLGLTKTLKSNAKKQSPHLSHPPMRFASSLGHSQGLTYTKLTFRPGVHDLDSPYKGYQRGSSFSFLTTELRYFQDRENVRIEKIQLANLAKLRGANSLEEKPAWHLDYSLQAKNQDQACEVCLEPNLKTSVGYSLALAPNLLDFYTLAIIIIRPHVETTPYGAGAGLNVGAIFTPIPVIRLRAGLILTASTKGHRLEGSHINVRVDVNDNLDISLTHKSERYINQQWSDGSLGFGYRF